MKVYLGDSVYADFRSNILVLTTENGPGEPSNTIYLEPETYAALLAYVGRLGQPKPEPS